MSLTLNSKDIEQHGLQHVLRYAFATGLVTYQLKLKDKISWFSGAAIAGTVYLPPVSEVAGETFFIGASSVATGNVTVKPFEGGTGVGDSTINETTGGSAATSEALAGAKAHLLLFSTGVSWIVLAIHLDLA